MPDKSNDPNIQKAVHYRDWTSVSHYGAAVQQLSTEMTEESTAFKVRQLFLKMAPYCLATNSSQLHTHFCEVIFRD